MDKEEIALQFNNAAEKYDNQRKVFIHFMDTYYGVVKSYLQYRNVPVKSVLDLGAGTGLLTKCVVEVFPDASYKLMDVAVKMLDIAKNKFRIFPNVTYTTK